MITRRELLKTAGALGVSAYALQGLGASSLAASDPTFGTTTVGGSSKAFLAGVKRVNGYTLSEAGSVSKLSIYLEPNATGTAYNKPVIYADADGEPGALIAVGNQVSFSNTQAAGWHDLPFSSPVNLEAGRYWIGVITGGTSGVAGYRYTTVTGSRRYNNNPYANGPTDPFGTPVTDDEQMSLYAAYTTAPASGALYYAPDSLWNAFVPAGAALDPNSATIVNWLVGQTQTYPNGISSAKAGTPFYIAGPNQPTVKVTNTGPQKDLQPFWNAVPIPAGAVPSNGTDLRMVIFQPSTDRLWEFWHAAKSSSGAWSAGGGGHMYYQSQDPGYFREVHAPDGTPLEHPNWGGVACSLGMAGGTMMIEECLNGKIEHALCLALRNCRGGVWAAPCQRTDGTLSLAASAPEGAHFVLDPNLDIPSLGLGPFVQMMAVAAQEHGIVINNRTGNGQAFRTEDPRQWQAANGYDPFMGPNGPGKPDALYDDWPAAMLKTFPWKHLRLLKMDLRRTADNTVFTETPPN